MIKLKDNIPFESLNGYTSWQNRSIVISNNNDNIINYSPLELQWYSHWEWNNTQCDFIEINKSTREIRCQGCEDILFEMMKDGLIEKVVLPTSIYKYFTYQKEENNE